MDKNTLKMMDSPVEDDLLSRDFSDLSEELGFGITHFRRSSVGKARNRRQNRRFDFYSLCHLYRGRGWFWREGQGERSAVAAGDAVLVTPGLVMDYAGDGEAWREDFICFDGPVARAFERAGVLKTGVYRFGEHRSLLPIIELAANPSLDAQMAAGCSLQKRLLDLHMANKTHHEDGGPEAKVQALIRQLQSRVQEWWTVEDMAKACELSVNGFREIFRRQTGQAPKAYLERMKMTHAAEQLCCRFVSIKALALEYSYRDPYHFSRVFKRWMGRSPKHYRETFSNHMT